MMGEAITCFGMWMIITIVMFILLFMGRGD